MGGATAELNLARLMVRRQSILGSVLRPRPVSDKADIIARFRDTVLPFFVRGEIVPVIDSVYPLADVVAAHQRMEASEHFGKIVLSVNAKET
jgi:NADPH:quinone reductase-like Zn-dependent oxidoreductase